MSNDAALNEFRTRWLPNGTDAGLRRLVELLERGSPQLIHGAFVRSATQGCLATHLGWNHPATGRHHEEAGVCWLTRVAKLNPATSAVVLAWDRAGVHDWELRHAFLAACRDELATRADRPTAVNRIKRLTVGPAGIP